ncbi:MAG: hypothetical protein OXI92_01745 [Acidobacteriota bacterium]|nr:hypothetical protein [Acidobacteriota bacterium]
MIRHRGVLNSSGAVKGTPYRDGKMHATVAVRHPSGHVSKILYVDGEGQ